MMSTPSCSQPDDAGPPAAKCPTRPLPWCAWPIAAFGLLCHGLCLVAALVAWVCWADQPGAENKKPLLVTISQETTYIVEPLRPDGYVDYVEALNQIASKGVTPENNAAVLLWQALGPKKINEKVRERFFQRLGISPLPEEGEYFIPFEDFVKKHPAAKPAPPPARQPEDEDGPPPEEKQFDRAQQGPWSQDDCPLVAAWLAANEKPLRLVVQATRRPRYYEPLLGAEEDCMVMALLLPGVSETRGFARAFNARAMQHVQAGRLEAAWEDLLACHRLGRLAGQGPTLVHSLVGIAIDGMACNGDRLLAHCGRPTAAQASKFEADLRGLAPLPQMAEKVNVAERFMYLDAVCLIAREGPSRLTEMAAIVDSGEGRQHLRTTQVLTKWATNASINWDEVLRMGNAFYDQFVAAASKPTCAERRAALGELDKELHRLRAKIRDPMQVASELLDGDSPRRIASRRMGWVFLSLLLPGMSAAVDAENRAATNVQLTQIALALAAHRADRGSYPDRLAQLAPKYLPEVPKDVYHEKEFCYRRDGADYVLYTAGPNGQDDGGRGLVFSLTGRRDEEADCKGDDIGFCTGNKGGAGQVEAP